MDWGEVMGKLDDRCVDIITGMAQGMMNHEVAKALSILARKLLLLVALIGILISNYYVYLGNVNQPAGNEFQIWSYHLLSLIH